MRKKSENASYIHQTQVQQSYSEKKTLLEHSCQLNIDLTPGYVRQTSIVCTLGDSWANLECLENMILNGANIFRLNMTLNTKEFYEKIIKIVREIEAKYTWNPCVAIAVDLTAPTVRTGMIHGSMDAAVTLKEGALVTLTSNDEYKMKSNESVIFIDLRFFPKFLDSLLPADKIFLDDGGVHLEVINVVDDKVNCKVILPGELGSLKRLQLTHNRAFSAHQIEAYYNDLEWAKSQNVDMVFTSMDETMDRVKKAKEILGSDIALLPKIETRLGVSNFADIISCSDGIIINRGTLGTEYSQEKIFKLQKSLIARCMVAKKPVFVIHQLLESMCFKPRATRAEVCDVGNAVLDGADGLILGVETARGDFPLQCLQVMHKTCREAEGAIFHEHLQRELKNAQDAIHFGHSSVPVNIQKSVTDCTVATTALAAVEAAFNIHATAILVPTISGRSAQEIASYRPSCPVVAIVRRPEVARRLHLYRGVHPYVFTGDKEADWASDMDLRLNSALEKIRERGFVSTGDIVVCVNGWNPFSGTTNTVRMIPVPEKGVSVPVLCQAVSQT
ncbi:hypothetical protein Ciccas_012067, partial [Cichlidogyrus casuarinus]